MKQNVPRPRPQGFRVLYSLCLFSFPEFLISEFKMIYLFVCLPLSLFWKGFLSERIHFLTYNRFKRVGTGGGINGVSSILVPKIETRSSLLGSVIVIPRS